MDDGSAEAEQHAWREEDYGWDRRLLQVVPRGPGDAGGPPGALPPPGTADLHGRLEHEVQPLQQPAASPLFMGAAMRRSSDLACSVGGCASESPRAEWGTMGRGPRTSLTEPPAGVRTACILAQHHPAVQMLFPALVVLCACGCGGGRTIGCSAHPSTPCVCMHIPACKAHGFSVHGPPVCGPGQRRA